MNEIINELNRKIDHDNMIIKDLLEENTKMSEEQLKLILKMEQQEDMLNDAIKRIDDAIELTERLIIEYKLNYGEELSKMIIAYNTLLEILRGNSNE